MASPAGADEVSVPPSPHALQFTQWISEQRELSAVVDMSSAARRRRDAAPVNGHQWSATFRSDNGYGGASAAIEAEASMCASISR